MQGSDAGKAREEMVWTVHLLTLQPRQAAVTLFVCAALIGAAARIGPVPWLPTATAFALLGALGEFLLPVTYSITSEGASAARWLHQERITWDQARSIYLARDGIKLSPLGRAHRLEPFRGVFLRLTPETQAGAIELVRRYRRPTG